MKTIHKGMRPHVWLRVGMVLVGVLGWVGVRGAGNLTLSPIGPYCLNNTLLHVVIGVQQNDVFVSLDGVTIGGIPVSPQNQNQNEFDIALSTTLQCGPSVQLRVDFTIDPNGNTGNTQLFQTQSINIRCLPQVAYPTTPICNRFGDSIVPIVANFPNGSGFFTISGTGVPINTATGTVYGVGQTGQYTIHYEENGPCPTYEGHVPVTFANPTTAPTVSYTPTQLCKSSGTQTINPPVISPLCGGTYSITQQSGGPTVANNGTITIPPASPASTYYITFRPDAAACRNNAISAVTLIDNSVQIQCPTGSYCGLTGLTPLPTPINFPGISSGGTYFTNPSLGSTVLNATTGQINTDSVNSTTTYDLFYSTPPSPNCPARIFQASGSISIIATPAVSITYPQPSFCNDDPNPLPTSSPNGGTYSSPYYPIFSNGTIDLGNVNNFGTALPIFYETGSPCPAIDSFLVTIREREDAQFYYGNNPAGTVDSFCAGTTNIFAHPIGNWTSGGTFSVTNATGIINLESNTGRIISATPGMYTIRYQTPGICVASASFDVIIRAIPPISINYSPSDLCKRPLSPASPIALPSVQGHFYAPGLSIDSLTGVIDPNANSTSGGPFPVYYITDPPACPDTAVAYVRLLEPDNAVFHYGTDPNATSVDFCSNELDCYPEFDSTFSIGGTYSILTQSGQGTPILNGTSGRLIFNNFRGQVTIQYTTTPDPPCWSATHTFVVNVLPAPQANFNYTEAYYCQTGDTILPAPNYVDSLGKFVCLNSSNFIFLNAQQGSFIPNTIPPGFYTIEHQVWVGQDTNQCRSTVTDQVEIKAIDVSTHLESDTLVYCEEDTFTVTVNGNPQLPGGWLIKPNLFNTVIEDPSQYMGYYSGNLDTSFTLIYTGYGYCEEEDSIILKIDQRKFTSLSYLPGELGGNAYCTNDTTGPLVPSITGTGSFFYVIVGSGQLALDTLSGVIDLSASDQGVYNVHYRIDDFCRLDGLDTVTVFQGLDPNSLVLSYSASPDSLCEGDLLMLSAYNAQHRTLYVLGDSLGVVEPDFLLDSVWDQESIMVRYRDINGCYEDVHDTLHVHAYPTPTITPQDTLAYVKPENILVNLESNNPQTIFQWWLQLSDRNVTLKSDSSGFTAALDSGATDALRPNLELQLESTVTQVEYLIQPSSYGCVGEMDSVTFLLIPADNPAIFIPGAISPNGDGKNDEWRITWDESAVDENDYEILLFNRSGGRVLSMSPLVRTWDGENLPDGVYQYILRDKQGKFLKKGGLTIRRQVYLDKN